MYKILGIKKLKTTARRPQTNECIERWHRTLNLLLAKVVSEHHHDWSTYLNYVCFANNCTPHSATGFIPFLVLMGRQPRRNIDVCVCSADVSLLCLCACSADVSRSIVNLLRAPADSGSSGRASGPPSDIVSDVDADADNDDDEDDEF